MKIENREDFWIEIGKAATDTNKTMAVMLNAIALILPERGQIKDFESNLIDLAEKLRILMLKDLIDVEAKVEMLELELNKLKRKKE